MSKKYVQIFLRDTKDEKENPSIIKLELDFPNNTMAVKDFAEAILDWANKKINNESEVNYGYGTSDFIWENRKHL